MVGTANLFSDASKIFHWLLKVQKFERVSYNFLFKHCQASYSIHWNLCCHCNTEYSLVKEVAIHCIVYSYDKRQKCLMINIYMYFFFCAGRIAGFLEAPRTCLCGWLSLVITVIITMSWNQAELPGRADSKDCTDIMYVNAKCSALSVIFEEECIALLLSRYWSTEELKKKKKKNIHIELVSVVDFYAR